MMRWLSALGAACLVVAAPARAAETCAPLPDRSEERAQLLARLAGTPDPMAGQAAANDVWAFWVRAPDDRAQMLLNEGMEGIRYGDLAGAEAVLGDLIAYCPDFAEGWNQRAFARFLIGDNAGSLADIEQALMREPAHFGALSGKIMILARQGKRQLARLVVIEALRVHPWLQEGALLGQGSGQDI